MRVERSDREWKVLTDDEFLAAAASHGLKTMSWPGFAMASLPSHPGFVLHNLVFIGGCQAKKTRGKAFMAPTIMEGAAWLRGLVAAEKLGREFDDAD